VLRGGAGDDRLIGGAGLDTADYAGAAAGVRVTLATSAAQNTLGDGIDRLAQIENLRGSQHADALTGNTGANLLAGGDGADLLTGAAGDDTLIGGNGADTLNGGDGSDVLIGGGGNDRFLIGGTGEAMVIVDLVGIDALDALAALAGVRIDLRAGFTSLVDGRSVTLGGAGLRSPLDVVFLQDLSGSFGDDIATVRGLVPEITAAVRAVQVDSRCGVASFVDKPFGGFGSGGDYTYRQDLALTASDAALAATYGALSILSGNDSPEAQAEALLQLALRQGTIGYRGGASRFVVLFTDADFHIVGDGLAAGIPIPNNGDTVLDGTPPGSGEDYPTIAQLRAALETAGLIPIFAVSGGNSVEQNCRDLVAELGIGFVTALSSDSANIVSVLTTGFAGTTISVIENAFGSAFGDTLIGDDAANLLDGRGGADTVRAGGGADTIVGGLGDDSLDGGAGFDFASYAGAAAAVTVSLALAGAQDTGGAGLDRLAKIEGLIGSAFADVLRGNAAGNLLRGGAGNDTLSGGWRRHAGRRCRGG